MPTATVLIPTHNHGRLLAYSIASALAQTIASLELFIVGDGVDAATRAVALELVASDPRVRFFDRPKGQRHGELTRHEVLQEATGTIVCYLSDDDLWLPHHVETMVTALRDADFAHAVPLFIDASGCIQVHPGDLDVPSVRTRMYGRFNFIPLSAAAHTLELYRRLPLGWTPAPPTLPTDLHMWQQILALDGCRAVATERTTLVNFPAWLRRDWSMEQRADELSRWSERARTGTLEVDLATAGLHRVMRSFVDAEDSARVAADEAESTHAVLVAERDAERVEQTTLREHIAGVRHDLAAAVARTASLQEGREADRKTWETERAHLHGQIATLHEHLAAGNERAATSAAQQARLQEQMAALRNDLVAEHARTAAAQHTVLTIQRTLTWRWRHALLTRTPLAAVWARLRRSKTRSGS